MAEWPLRLWRAPKTGWTEWRQIENPEQEWGVSCSPGAEDVEVISADLARELYEVLKRGEANGYDEEFTLDADAAIARYEQEIGE